MGWQRMSIRQIARETLEEEAALRDGLIARSRQDGCRYVLKPAGSFLDAKVVDWLAMNWHTGVPRCVGQTPGPAGGFYVFEYIQGTSFDKMQPAEGRAAAPGYLLSLMLQWSQILGFLHLRGQKPLLHLDIKPANMVVDGQGNAGLIDFTTARLLEGDQAEEAGLARKCLTLNYAAPELTRGQPCPGSDLYALGLAVLVAWTGQNPADCRSQALRDILGHMPAAVQTLFTRCLHVDPALRHPHAEALAYDIRQAMRACEQPADGHEEPRQTVIPANAPENLSGKAETAAEADQAVEERLPAALLCVWDGAACGCELAAALADKQDVLVVDANLLNPRADFLLGQQNQIIGFAANGERGLDLACQAEQQSRLSPQLLQSLARETAIPHVRLLSFANQLEDYEYCPVDSLFQTLKWARLISDVVIVLCNRSLFDAFTCLCIMAADQVVIPLGGNAGDFREMNRAVAFLVARYNLGLAKFSYVAFPYDRKNDLSQGTLNELCDGRLLGCISDLPQRRKRTCHAKPYAAALSDKTRHEYRCLIRSLRLPGPQHKET